MEFIDLKSQYQVYRSRIDAAIQRVLDHGRFIQGPEIQELEAVLAAYVGCRHAITVASGTDSLEIAVANYTRYHRLEASEVLVVLDDIAIPLGDLRRRDHGSFGIPVIRGCRRGDLSE